MNKLKYIILVVLFNSAISFANAASAALCFNNRNITYSCCQVGWVFNRTSNTCTYGYGGSQSNCNEDFSVFDKDVSLERVCDSQNGGPGGGVVVDGKIKRVCVFQNLEDSNSITYKFLAWTYTEGRTEVYTSSAIMNGLDSEVSLTNAKSYKGEAALMTDNDYEWKTANGDKYRASKLIYSNPGNPNKLWLLTKNDEPITRNAKCMLYSDTLKNGWTTREAFSSLPSY